MVSFMEVLQTSHRSQNSSAISLVLAVYFKQYVHAGPLIRRFSTYVMDTINDGTLYLQGACLYEYFARKGHKLADTLLITE